MSGEQPHWEHGYRCHGYWIGTKRVGWVGIGPRPLTRVKRDGYEWGVLVNEKVGHYFEGHSKTLWRAKRAVEKAYAARKRR